MNIFFSLTLVEINSQRIRRGFAMLSGSMKTAWRLRGKCAANALRLRCELIRSGVAVKFTKWLKGGMREFFSRLVAMDKNWIFLSGCSGSTPRSLPMASFKRFLMQCDDLELRPWEGQKAIEKNVRLWRVLLGKIIKVTNKIKVFVSFTSRW